MKRFLVCLSALIPCLASTQNWTGNWYTIAGGGGSSTGATYRVSGTVGQPEAGGPMSGGGYALTGGFWALLAGLQTPGAPALCIARASSSVTVYWENVPGWGLQQNNDPALPANWAASTGVTTSSGTNYLNLVSPSGKMFFRLKRQ